MRRSRVALVATANSTFVQWDREILQERFDVVDVGWRGKHSIPHLVWAVRGCDVAVSWFALDHAYGACRVARLFGRRSVVVVGGVDAAKWTELGYGAHLDPAVSRRSRYALAQSDRVLVVDDSLREEIARNTGIRRPEIVTVPLGFDTDLYRPDDRPKTNVLTVGFVTDVNLRRKGLETFVQAARLLPDLSFVLVGAAPSAATDHLRSQAPPNLRLLPPLGLSDLLEEYRRARVYVQASEYEGLPSALGEAMACGCVAVGTSVGGIPSLIGDTGFYVPPADPIATAKAIRSAYDSGRGDHARQRIAALFPRSKRRDALHRIIDDLVGP
jgi:glycosyltransferase involved in cell wall biosynthesis